MDFLDAVDAPFAPAEVEMDAMDDLGTMGDFALVGPSDLEGALMQAAEELLPNYPNPPSPPSSSGGDPTSEHGMEEFGSEGSGSGLDDLDAGVDIGSFVQLDLPTGAEPTAAAGGRGTRPRRASGAAGRQTTRVAVVPPSVPAGKRKPAAPRGKKKPPTVMSESELKRQRRMAKNRESASASRMRRKQYMDSLEARCKTLSEEREALLAKVAALEAENAALRRDAAPRPAVSAPRAAGATLLACLACVALVGGPGAGQGLAAQPTATLGRAPGRALQGLHQVPASAAMTAVRPSAPEELRPLVVESPQGGMLGEGMIDEWLKDYEDQLALLGSNASGLGEVTGEGDADAVPSTALATMDGATALDASGLFVEPGRPPVWRLPPGLKESVFGGVTIEPTSSYIFCSEVSMLAARKPHQDGRPRVAVVLPTPQAPSVVRDKHNSTAEDGGAFALLQIDAVVTGSQSQLYRHDAGGAFDPRGAGKSSTAAAASA